jgi:SEC-C motif domain protein
MPSVQRLRPSDLCPCGRLGLGNKPASFGQCCGSYLDAFAAHPAPDAQSLMRSRYTAFVLERADYLLATWHPSHRPASLSFEAGVKWLGLEVRHVANIDATHAEVEFVARQKSPGAPAVRLHERSRFQYASGRWLYVDGDAL